MNASMPVSLRKPDSMKIQPISTRPASRRKFCQSVSSGVCADFMRSPESTPGQAALAEFRGGLSGKLVKLAGLRIARKLCVETRRIVLLQPTAQAIELVRIEFFDRTLDTLERDHRRRIARDFEVAPHPPSLREGTLSPRAGRGERR